jgi:hypothetical protein
MLQPYNFPSARFATFAGKHVQMAIESVTTSNNTNLLKRLGAITAIGGAVLMLIGAALWGSTGTDLWQSLDGGNMADYLRAVANSRSALVANTVCWITGVLTLGVAGCAMAELGTRNRAAAAIATVCFRTAVPLAIVAFLSMLALAIQIAPDAAPNAIAIAEVVGWIGARADDIATVLIIGAGPFFLSLAGRGDWAPNWLAIWGYLAGILGLFSLSCLFFPGMVQFSFIILPPGMGWLIAAGIVLLRQEPAAQ